MILGPFYHQFTQAIGSLKHFTPPFHSRGACFCVARPPPNIGEHRKGSMLA